MGKKLGQIPVYTYCIDIYIYIFSIHVYTYIKKISSDFKLLEKLDLSTTFYLASYLTKWVPRKHVFF